MERLIADANEWGAANGEASNLSIDSFADVVTAIEQIQKKQGIYGTTQKEALNTIEGSTNAFKASWKNLVAEMGKPDADLVARVSDMMAALFGKGGEGGLVRNVTKEVGVIGSNMVNALRTAITTAANWLFENGPQLVNKGIRAFVSKAKQLTKAIKLDPPNLMESFGEMFDGAGEIYAKIADFATDIVENFREWWPDIAEAALGLWNVITKTISDNASSIASAAGEAIGWLVDTIIEWYPKIHGAVFDLIGQAAVWVTDKMPDIAVAIGNFVTTELPKILSKIGDLVVKYGPKLFDAAIKMLANIGSAIMKYGPTIIANLVVTLAALAATVVSAASQMASAAAKWIGGMLTGLKDKWPEIRQWFSELPSRAMEAIGDVISRLLKKGREFLEGVRKGLEEKWPEVRKEFEDLPQKAFDAVGDVSSKLWQKGVDLINGLWNGLKSKWAEVRDWFADKISWINSESSGAGGGFSGGGGGGYGDDGGGGAFAASASAMPAGQAVMNGGPTINIYLDYNAGDDATQMVYDIAGGLKLALGGI